MPAAPPAMHPHGRPIDIEATGGIRRAALLLHAMAPSDRDWILGALSAAERDALCRLLAELDELGIAADPSLVAQAIEQPGSVPDPVAHSAPMSDEDMLRALDGPALQAMLDLLRREPVGLVASWLRAADWPWRQELLAALDPRDRQRVEALLAIEPAGPAPDALRAELIAAVAGRLRERTAGSAAASARSRARFGVPWRRLWPGGND